MERLSYLKFQNLFLGHGKNGNLKQINDGRDGNLKEINNNKISNMLTTYLVMKILVMCPEFFFYLVHIK